MFDDDFDDRFPISYRHRGGTEEPRREQAGRAHGEVSADPDCAKTQLGRLETGRPANLQRIKVMTYLIL